MKRVRWLLTGVLLILMGKAWGCYRAESVQEVGRAAETVRASVPARPLSALLEAGCRPGEDISLSVKKSRLELTVRCSGRNIKQYPIVLGFNPKDDKRREGDGCTPEGRFTIANIAPSRKWAFFCLLNYPTNDSRRKFNRAKRQGLISPNATIGSAVGIHGVPKNGDSLIDSRTNWTYGCISLKTADIKELRQALSVGTVIQIAK